MSVNCYITRPRYVLAWQYTRGCDLATGFKFDDWDREAGNEVGAWLEYGDQTYIVAFGDWLVQYGDERAKHKSGEIMDQWEVMSDEEFTAKFKYFRLEDRY